MRFELAGEHYEFAGILQRALDQGIATVRSLWDNEELDTTGFPQLLASLGVNGLTAPESAGGSGLLMSDSVLVFEVLGRTLVPEPIAETVGVIIPAISRFSDGSASEHLDRFIAGSFGTIQDGWDGWAPWAGRADLGLVIDGDDVTMVEIRLDDVEPLRGQDPARRIGRISKRAKVIERLEGAGATVRQRVTTVTASMLYGASVAMIDLSAAYARDREQFGRPIGSFQAVKHQLADALTAVEGARRTTWWAAWCLDHDRPERAEAVSLAKARNSEAALLTSRVALQVHGGIGYTWDCNLHLFMKRAEVLAASWGTARHHYHALTALYDVVGSEL